MGEPDQIIYMSDEPHTVPAEGAVEYQYLTADPGWTTDKWLQATETRPGNRSVVHHCVVRIQPQRTGSIFPEAIGYFAPGFGPYVCPPGAAIRVPARSKLTFQLHYTPNGVEQTDRSMIAIRFADPKTVTKMLRGQCVSDQSFKIPANNPDYLLQLKQPILKDTLLLSMMPHMHLRGRSFRYEAEYPTERARFCWTYRASISPGSCAMCRRLRSCCRKVRSSSAPPTSTTRPKTSRIPIPIVSYRGGVGPQTFDEMMEGFLFIGRRTA